MPGAAGDVPAGTSSARLTPAHIDHTSMTSSSFFIDHLRVQGEGRDGAIIGQRGGRVKDERQARRLRFRDETTVQFTMNHKNVCQFSFALVPKLPFWHEGRNCYAPALNFLPVGSLATLRKEEYPYEHD